MDSWCWDVVGGDCGGVWVRVAGCRMGEVSGCSWNFVGDDCGGEWSSGGDSMDEVGGCSVGFSLSSPLALMSSSCGCIACKRLFLCGWENNFCNICAIDVVPQLYIFGLSNSLEKHVDTASLDILTAILWLLSCVENLMICPLKALWREVVKVWTGKVTLSSPSSCRASSLLFITICTRLWCLWWTWWWIDGSITSRF